MVPTQFCELLGAMKGCTQGSSHQDCWSSPHRQTLHPPFIPRPPQAHPELPHSIISTPNTILFPTWVLSLQSRSSENHWEVKRWNQEVFKHPGSKGWAFSFLSCSQTFLLILGTLAVDAWNIEATLFIFLAPYLAECAFSKSRHSGVFFFFNKNMKISQNRKEYWG